MGKMYSPTQVNPVLLTPRLRLEPQTAAHADTMLHVLADPQTHLFIPSEPPNDVTTLRDRYARLESRRSPDGTALWLNWVVFHHIEALGTVQASVHLMQDTADVAYVFHPTAWGKGYAAEAMQALLNFLRDGLKVERVKANIDTRNASSQRLIERLGFILVDEVKGSDEFKGAMSDEFVYELR